MMKKFNHMTEKDMEILQEDIEYEYCLLGGLSVLEAECQLPVSAQDQGEKL
jgi:pyruvate ferredoxin oxidoreductase beta subunit/phenylglyoxylate dehydrogenase beta subunit